MHEQGHVRFKPRLQRRFELYIRILLVYMTVLYLAALHVKQQTIKIQRRPQLYYNQTLGRIGSRSDVKSFS